MQEEHKAIRLTYTDEKSTVVEENWTISENIISTPTRTYYRNHMWDNCNGQGNKFYFCESDSGELCKLRYYKGGYCLSGECEVPEVPGYERHGDSWTTEFGYQSAW